MRFTIHTPDGETYTTPNNTHPHYDEGTGALHIRSDDAVGATPIAIYPAGQWTRYVPADEGEHAEDEPWLGSVAAMWAFLESKSRSTTTPYEFTMQDISGYYNQLRKTAREFADVGIR